MRTRAFFFSILLATILASCSLNEQPEQPSGHSLTLSPSVVSAEPGEVIDFEAVLDLASMATLTWSSEAGKLTPNGRSAKYTAPTTLGDYEVTVELVAEDVHATATVTVSEPHPLTPGVTLSLANGATMMATGTTTTISATFAEWLHGTSAVDLVWEATGGTITAMGADATYTAPTTVGDYVVSASIPGIEEAIGSLVVDVPGAILEPFTIAVIPDTQTLTIHGDERGLVEGTCAWLVDNLETLNIEFVTHLGDVVWGDNTKRKAIDTDLQWVASLAGLDLLDGVVPYSVSLGDHEYEIEEDKASSTAAYFEHFGPARYEAYDWYGGAHEKGLSHYQIFEAGGRKFLHLNLEWEPLGPASDITTPLGWARGVLEEHPSLPTFISTHAYLWDKKDKEGHFPNSAREGFLKDKDDIAPNTASGVEIFETLVEPFPQVLMVFNGHYHKAEDKPWRGEFHQVSENDNGQSVYEMLSNYQWMEYEDDPDWIRLIEFLPGDGDDLDTISVSTFSPSRAGTSDEYRDRPSSSFSFELDLAERLAFSSPVTTP